MVATCAQSGNLDVFELPLAGEIPESWTSERVRLELELVGRREEQLLLYRRHLRDAKTPAGRHLSLVRMVRLHLEANEFDAARFYARAEGHGEDAATQGIGRRLEILVEHRRQVREREQGREVGAFARLTEERINALVPEAGDSLAAQLLGHVIRSELADAVGDKRQARRELEAAKPHEKTPRAIIELYAERADALYRSLDQREPLIAAYRGLAQISSLPVDARLGYARAAVKSMFRGRPYDQDDRFAPELGRFESADSELAFALELGRALRLRIGRAYRERAAGDLTAARADYERVVEHTHSLEALVGAIDLRMRAGERQEAIADGILRSDQPGWLKAFAQAYLKAHELRTLSGEAHARAIDDALAHLRGSWGELRRQRLAQALVGAIRHEAYLETEDFAQAERASGNYEVALRGLRSNLRVRAMLLGQLGVLQTQVGNFRIALTSLNEREQLPYVDNAAGLAVRLARARALLHVGRTDEAADIAEQALAMIAPKPYLREYRVLALDRAALYALAARRYERALAHYEGVLELLAGSQTNPRNRVTTRLGHAAAALGAGQPEKTLADLSAVQQVLDGPDAAAAVVSRHAEPKDVLRSYRLISSGLEANALTQVGRSLEASRALERKRQLLADIFKQADRDEDLQALTLVETQLATNAVDRGDDRAVARWARAALDHGSALGQRTQTRLPQEERDGLWLAAELAGFRGIRVDDELPARVKNAISELARRRDRNGRSEVGWLEICLALMML